MAPFRITSGGLKILGEAERVNNNESCCRGMPPTEGLTVGKEYIEQMDEALERRLAEKIRQAREGELNFVPLEEEDD